MSYLISLPQHQAKTALFFFRLEITADTFILTFLCLEMEGKIELLKDFIKKRQRAFKILMHNFSVCLLKKQSFFP